MLKVTQKGFTILLPIIGFVILTAIIAAGWVVMQRKQGSLRGGTTCDKPFALEYDVIDFENIEQVTPPGSIINGHWKTHSYINFKDKDVVDVRAPSDMTLKSGAKYTQNGQTQYTFNFEATCGFSFAFDHVNKPIQSVADQFSGDPQDDTHSINTDPIFFAAGEVFAQADGNGVQRQFDFGVYDSNTTNGLEDDSKYYEWTKTGSSKYKNAVCPYDHYPPAKRAQYYALFDSSNFDPMPTTFCN